MNNIPNHRNQSPQPLQKPRSTKITVSMLAAITIDGFIGRDAAERSFDWTSSEDKIFYRTHLQAADAVIVGSTTFKTFHRLPQNKQFRVMTRFPEIFMPANDQKVPESTTITPTNQSPTELLASLKNEGATKILIAGGSSVYRQFLQADLIDHMFITVEPVIFGQGISLFDASIQDTKRKPILQKAHHLSDQTIVLEYRFN